MAKTINKFYIYFILFFYASIIFNKIIIYELYEEKLIELINKLFNKEECESINKKKISDFYYKKSINLTFREACELYIVSMKNPENNFLQIQHSLERMYSLCPDARISELILWNLAQHYSKQSKYSISGDMFCHFRKLFPGSKYYWKARINEITDLSNLCLTHKYDSSQTEHVISLCKQYIIDSNELKSKIDSMIIHTMHNMYINIIKKELYIIDHYLNKHIYMKDPICIYSSVQRTIMLSEIFISGQDYLYENENKSDLKEIKYRKIFEEIQQLLKEFNELHNIALPEGTNFKESYDLVIEYIDKNNDKLKSDIKCLIEKIICKLDIYYEH